MTNEEPVINLSQDTPPNNNDPVVDLFEIRGMFESITYKPTLAPNSVYNQIKIYSLSGDNRLYWFDAVNKRWNYVTATAPVSSLSPSISPSVSPS